MTGTDPSEAAITNEGAAEPAPIVDAFLDEDRPGAWAIGGADGRAGKGDEI